MWVAPPAFLDEMRSAGWQTCGIEISPTAADYARQRFQLDVQIGDLLEIDLPAASFDLITMWDVLEHTFAPREVLAKSASLLKPGGLLALTFPQLGESGSQTLWTLLGWL